MMASLGVTAPCLRSHKRETGLRLDIRTGDLYGLQIAKYISSLHISFRWVVESVVPCHHHLLLPA